MFKNMTGVYYTLAFIFLILGIYPQLRYLESTEPTQHRPQFEKIIVVLVDGLRYDALPQQEQTNQNTKQSITEEGKMENKVDTVENDLGLYRNNFDFSYAEDNVTFLSITSSPTLTKCRMYDLFTGKHMNYINYLLAHVCSREEQDTLFNSILKSGKTFKMYGDPLSLSTFPKLKGHSWDTANTEYSQMPVEDEVLFTRLKEDLKSDWSGMRLLYSHVVDTYGHFHHAVNHPNIQKMLQSNNRWIKEIYDTVGDDTLIILTSDHGVTNKGDHGGAAPDETASLISLISKRKLFSDGEKNPGSNIPSNKLLSHPYEKKYNVVGKLHQDDTMPILCSLIGISPPSNTKGIIPKQFDKANITDQLIKNKEKLLEKNGVNPKNLKVNDKMDKYDYSELLSEKIRHIEIAPDKKYIIISVALQIITLVLLWRNVALTIADVGSVFVLFLDIFNETVHAYRGIIFMTSFTGNSFSLKNLIIWLTFAKITKLCNMMNAISIEMLVFAYIVVHAHRNRRFDSKAATEGIMVFLPVIITKLLQTEISLIDVHHKGKYTRSIELNTFILTASPSLSSLGNVLFGEAGVVFLTMVAMGDFDYKCLREQSWAKFFLVNAIPHAFDFNYTSSSLDYNMAFLLHKTLDAFTITVSYIFFFFGPRMLVFWKFMNSKKIGQVKKEEKNTQYNKRNEQKRRAGIFTNQLTCIMLIVLVNSSAIIFVSHEQWVGIFLERTTWIVLLNLLDIGFSYAVSFV